MKLILIRHSQTSSTKDCPISLWGLSQEGIKKACPLANQAAIKALDVLYSSNQTKAIETALLLAKPNQIPIKTDPDLTEISSFTKKYFEGGEEYRRNVDEFYAGKIKRIAGGESIKEALTRFNLAVGKKVKIETRLGNDLVGIVSHGNILAFFSAQFCSKTPRQLHGLIQMPDWAVLDWKTKKFIKFFGDEND